MQTKLFLACFLFGVALSSLFTDIVKGLVDSKSNKISSFVDNIPKDLLSTLETNEQQAGQFVCQILHGNIPGVIDELATEVWDEIKDDWSAITEFIEALPTLAPEILDDIIQDGEDVVSVVEEIFTNPDGALTLIENDVKTVISDIESVAEGIWHGLTCLFKNCATSSTVDPAATLSSSCQVVLAAATTTYRPSSTTSTYKPAQTIYVTTTTVPKTSTMSTTKLTTTSTTKSATTSTTKPATTSTTKATTTITPSASTILAAQASSVTTSTTQAVFQQQGGSSGGKIEMSISSVWLGLSVCFLFAVFAL